MSSAEFWFDSGFNTTQYGGFSDEKILDPGPTVWAQRPFQSLDPASSLLKTGPISRRFTVLLDCFLVKLAFFKQHIKNLDCPFSVLSK